MSEMFKWLQFFADGGAAGGEGGAAEGVEAGDPGQQTLEDLGVPKKIAERHVARKARTAPVAEPEAAEAQQQADGQNGGDTPSIPSWDDFMKVPENNQRMQQIMSDRLKKQGKANDEYMAKLNPALEILAAKYGIEAKDGKIDADALSSAIADDDSFYEDRAVELGVDVDTAKHISQLESFKARADAERAYAEEQALRAKQEQQRDMELRAHFAKIQQEANDLAKIFPNFDLQRELQDPKFLTYTSKEIGMSVQDAFYALHHDEIMSQQAGAIAQRTKADIANSYRSGRNHPRENGGGMASSTAGVPDFSKMTHEQRLAFVKKARPPR